MKTFNNYEILNNLNIEEEHREFKEAIVKIEEYDGEINDLENQKRILNKKLVELNELKKVLEDRINERDKQKNIFLLHFEKTYKDHLKINFLTVQELDNIFIFINSFYKMRFNKGYLFYMKMTENELYKKLIDLWKMLKIKKCNIPNSNKETINNYLSKNYYNAMTDDQETIFFLRKAITNLMNKLINFTSGHTKRTSLYNIEDITTYDII